MKLLSRLDQVLDQLCRLVLLGSVVAMIALVLLGIVLRWFESSLLWIDPLVRHLVLLAAFMGGVVAVGQDEHIAIDLCNRALLAQKKWQWLRWHKKIILFIAVVACTWLGVAAWPLVSTEWEFGRVRFLGLHSAVLVALIPTGFLLLALRFSLRLCLPIKSPPEGAAWRP